MLKMFFYIAIFMKKVALDVEVCYNLYISFQIFKELWGEIMNRRINRFIHKFFVAVLSMTICASMVATFFAGIIKVEARAQDLTVAEALQIADNYNVRGQCVIWVQNVAARWGSPLGQCGYNNACVGHANCRYRPRAYILHNDNASRIQAQGYTMTAATWGNYLNISQVVPGDILITHGSEWGSHIVIVMNSTTYKDANGDGQENIAYRPLSNITNKVCAIIRPPFKDSGAPGLDNVVPGGYGLPSSSLSKMRRESHSATWHGMDFYADVEYEDLLYKYYPDTRYSGLEADGVTKRATYDVSKVEPKLTVTGADHLTPEIGTIFDVVEVPCAIYSRINTGLAKHTPNPDTGPDNKTVPYHCSYKKITKVTYNNFVDPTNLPNDYTGPDNSHEAIAKATMTIEYEDHTFTSKEICGANSSYLPEGNREHSHSGGPTACQMNVCSITEHTHASGCNYNDTLGHYSSSSCYDPDTGAQTCNGNHHTSHTSSCCTIAYHRHDNTPGGCTGCKLAAHSHTAACFECKDTKTDKTETINAKFVFTYQVTDPPPFWKDFAIDKNLVDASKAGTFIVPASTPYERDWDGRSIRDCGDPLYPLLDPTPDSSPYAYMGDVNNFSGANFHPKDNKEDLHKYVYIHDQAENNDGYFPCQYQMLFGDEARTDETTEFDSSPGICSYAAGGGSPNDPWKNKGYKVNPDGSWDLQDRSEGQRGAYDYGRTELHFPVEPGEYPVTILVSAAWDSDNNATINVSVAYEIGTIKINRIDRDITQYSLSDDADKLNDDDHPAYDVEKHNTGDDFKLHNKDNPANDVYNGSTHEIKMNIDGMEGTYHQVIDVGYVADFIDGTWDSFLEKCALVWDNVKGLIKDIGGAINKVLDWAGIDVLRWVIPGQSGAEQEMLDLDIAWEFARIGEHMHVALTRFPKQGGLMPGASGLGSMPGDEGRSDSVDDLDRGVTTASMKGKGFGGEVDSDGKPIFDGKDLEKLKMDVSTISGKFEGPITAGRYNMTKLEVKSTLHYNEFNVTDAGELENLVYDVNPRAPTVYDFAGLEIFFNTTKKFDLGLDAEDNRKFNEKEISTRQKTLGFTGFPQYFLLKESEDVDPIDDVPDYINELFDIGHYYYTGKAEVLERYEPSYLYKEFGEMYYVKDEKRDLKKDTADGVMSIVDDRDQKLTNDPIEDMKKLGYNGELANGVTLGIADGYEENWHIEYWQTKDASGADIDGGKGKKVEFPQDLGTYEVRLFVTGSNVDTNMWLKDYPDNKCEDSETKKEKGYYVTAEVIIEKGNWEKEYFIVDPNATIYDGKNDTMVPKDATQGTEGLSEAEFNAKYAKVTTEYSLKNFTKFDVKYGKENINGIGVVDGYTITGPVSSMPRDAGEYNILADLAQDNGRSITITNGLSNGRSATIGDLMETENPMFIDKYNIHERNYDMTMINSSCDGLDMSSYSGKGFEKYDASVTAMYYDEFYQLTSDSSKSVTGNIVAVSVVPKSGSTNFVQTLINISMIDTNPITASGNNIFETTLNFIALALHWIGGLLILIGVFRFFLAFQEDDAVNKVKSYYIIAAGIVCMVGLDIFRELDSAFGTNIF